VSGDQREESEERQKEFRGLKAGRSENIPRGISVDFLKEDREDLKKK